jgi:peptidoglycan hydrolase-like protein with peptidoglycan-binding domain
MDDLRCQRGDSNDTVGEVQEILEDAFAYPLAGTDGGVDGIFGPSTEAAVKDFQAHNGLSATGVVDAATSALLQSSTALAKGEAGTISAATPTSALAIAGGVVGVPLVAYGAYRAYKHFKGR